MHLLRPPRDTTYVFFLYVVPASPTTTQGSCYYSTRNYRLRTDIYSPPRYVGMLDYFLALDTPIHRLSVKYLSPLHCILSIVRKSQQDYLNIHKLLLCGAKVHSDDLLYSDDNPQLINLLTPFYNPNKNKNK